MVSRSYRQRRPSAHPSFLTIRHCSNSPPLTILPTCGLQLAWETCRPIARSCKVMSLSLCLAQCAWFPTRARCAVEWIFMRPRSLPPVLDHAVPGWRGHYDWMPLPGAPLPQFAHPAACLRLLRSEPTASLMDGQRVAVMADTGIHLLQQRMAFHLCRVVIDLAELAEHSAPVLVKTDLLEEWVDSFGVGSEGSFHQFSR